MPSASLHFRLPQDDRDFRVMQAGMKYHDALCAFDGFLRNKVKYGDLPKPVREAYQTSRDELHRILEDAGVEIHL